MDILYVTSACSQSKFDKLVSEGKIASQFQNQKFHNLLLLGLRKVSLDRITVVSYYPIQRQYNQFNKYEEELVDGIKYVYPACKDIPIINHWSKFINTYKALKGHRTPDSIIVCNVMNFDECIAALHIGKRYGNKVVAIVADVPGKTSGVSKKNGAYWKRLLSAVFSPFYRSFTSKYDAYVLLTDAMNQIVNPKCQPYIVVEGFSDSKMANYPNELNCKSVPKVLLYAGGLHREYGIEMLVNAFEKIVHEGWELHIYGGGNYASELKKKSQQDNSIKYFGTRDNKEIVTAQIKASLLVNPRPTREEFVKYSFPSKNLECMASGTPLATTLLPGMPIEYKEHVFLLNDESVDGYANSLSEIFSLDAIDLHNFGLSAKQFVLTEKNNISQASRIYKLLKEL